MAPRCKARTNELHLSSAAEKAPAVGVNDRVQANHLGDGEERARVETRKHRWMCFCLLGAFMVETT